MSIEAYFERLVVALETLAGIGIDEEHPTNSTPVVNTTTGTTPTQAAPSTRRRRASAATTSAPPAASNAQPAASAPAAGQPAQSQGAPTQPANQTLLKEATEAVIKLANEYSRDLATAILGKERLNSQGARVPGVQRCSDLLPEFWAAVLGEANVAIAQAEAAKIAAAAAKSNSSLI